MRKILTSLLTISIILLLVGIADGASCIADGASWETKTPMPTKRTRHASAVVNGKIYIIGGWDYSIGALNIVEAYDPLTDTWETSTRGELAPMPTPRAWAAASVHNGKIYVFGGSDNTTAFDKVEVYDPLSDTWETLAAIPYPPRYDLTASPISVNGIIYVIGGFLWSGPEPTKYLNIVDAYNPSTGIWERLASMPTERHHMTCAVAGKYIYVIGGISYATINSCLDTVEVFDTETGEWLDIEIDPMPKPRTNLHYSAPVVDNKIFVIGGTCKDGSGHFDNVEALCNADDPYNCEWKTNFLPMPTARSGLTVSAVCGKIYAIGGTSSMYLEETANEELSVYQSPVDQIENIITNLQDIIDSNLDSKDKLEDVIDKLETALDELDKTPPDNQAVIGNIEGAIGDLEAAVNDELLDFEDGTQIMNCLAGVARKIAIDVLEAAIENGGDQDEIKDAQKALDEGDALREIGYYKDAVNKYKDAVAKAESANPNLD